jgi:predicted nucleic acid-binding Zn ribbon protein
MLARAFGKLRILCRTEGSRNEVQRYIQKQGCHTTFAIPKICKQLHSNSAHPHCWKCGSEIPNSNLFCSQCSTLQKPDESKNYFDVLCIQEGFEIEDKELTTKYRKLQNVLHPDRFSVKNAVRCSNLKPCTIVTISV